MPGKGIVPSTSLRAGLLVGAVLAAGEIQAQEMTATERPNILFILMDNLGYGEVGAYGGGITRGAPTPEIDARAAEGLRLTNFNVEAQCTPSRSAIMTGRFSIRSGTHSIPIGGGLEGLTRPRRRGRRRSGCRSPGSWRAGRASRAGSSRSTTSKSGG